MGQGIVCLQYRAEDEETRKIISTIFDNNNFLDKVNAFIEMAEAQQFVWHIWSRL